MSLSMALRSIFFIAFCIPISANARGLVVPVELEYDEFVPDVRDIAGIPSAYGFSYPGIIYRDPLPPTSLAAFSPPGASETLIVSPSINRDGISNAVFSGSWNNALWPFSILSIPYGSDSDVFRTPDMSRISADAISLRVGSIREGLNVGTSTFSGVVLELRQNVMGGTRIVGDVMDDAQFKSGVPAIVDFPSSAIWPGISGAGPSSGTELGLLRFRGWTRSNPISTASMTAAWSMMVTDPEIITMVPYSQLGSSTRSGWGSNPPDDPWGTRVYAEKAYDDYVASLPVTDPRVATYNSLKSTYMFGRKGCTLTSWTMAINALGIDVATPVEVMDKLEAKDLLTIKGIVPDSTNSTISYTVGANITPWVLRQIYPDLQTENLGGLSFTDAELKMASEIAKGNPVILRLGYSTGERDRHTVIAYGASARTDGTIVFDIIDSYPRDGSAATALIGDRYRDPSSPKAVAGTSLSLSEMDTQFGLTLGKSYVVSKEPPGLLDSLSFDGIFQSNCAVEITITDPSGNQIRFDTLNGLISSDIDGVIVEREVPDIAPDIQVDEEAWQQMLGGYLPTVVSIPGEAMMEDASIKSQWLDLRTTLTTSVCFGVVGPKTRCFASPATLRWEKLSALAMKWAYFLPFAATLTKMAMLTRQTSMF